MSAIEQGRQNLIEREEVRAASKEIFNTAIDVLKAKGVEKRILFLKTKDFRYTSGLRNPGVPIAISAYNDLRKAKRVSFFIEGNGWMYFGKTGAEGRERFHAYNIGFLGHHAPASKDKLHSYRIVLREIGTEMGLH